MGIVFGIVVLYIFYICLACLVQSMFCKPCANSQKDNQERDGKDRSFERNGFSNEKVVNKENSVRKGSLPPKLAIRKRNFVPQPNNIKALALG